MLRSVKFENLASHLFSTLLFVVLVSHVFIGPVSFIGNVGFGLERVARSYSFLLANFLFYFIQFFRISFVPLQR